MIKLSKKVIAFDLDGTLAVSKQPITKDMALLVEDLAKEKIIAVISGGTFKQFNTQFLPPFSQEDLESAFIKNLILLPTSGSQRYEYNLEKKEWTLTDIELFPEKEKQKARKVLKEMIDSGLYDIPKNPTGEYIEDRLTQLSISALGQEAPIEQKKLWDPDQKKRQKMKVVLDKELPETSIIIGGTTTIDILPKGFNKATGLERLLEKLGMTIDDMVFVGDAIFPGGNDYSAFEAGIESIKVSGPEETKETIKKWIV
jgi:HAD superfamily hydrolase (TIGR01484 family)